MPITHHESLSKDIICLRNGKLRFDALLNDYNKDLFRFEFKSTGARNNALKFLEKSGFDYDLVEDLKGYVVELPQLTWSGKSKLFLL